jgi:hypothetical protein
MFDLKRISKEGVPAAIQKAERYRLLNQAWAAESICLDVLETDPENQQALVILLLALTDQFRDGLTDGLARARAVLPRLKDEYKRTYYSGIICERQAMAELARGLPGSGSAVHDWLREAMSWYERAEALRPAGNEESILRWNTCARVLQRGRDHLVPREAERYEPSFGE